MIIRRFTTLILLAGVLCVAQFAVAADEGGKSLADLKAAFVSNYAAILQAEYVDSLEQARQMQTAIGAFLDKPSPESMKAAREAWVRCRKPYMQSEVGRFYDGPIDAVEGFINSWPIDENYLDYTEADADAGIINQPGKFPVITREVLLGANEKEGEKNISTGFHAIEFLLWGQDLYADGPGRRSHLDYMESTKGPGLHAARRREYLRQLAALLVEHIGIVSAEWAPERPGNYRARLQAMPPDAALASICSGLGNLSGAELSGERLLVPYTTKSQENEHSCFSDTTHLDLLQNEIGIRDICVGRYDREKGGAIQGTGLDDLIEKVDPGLAATLRRQLEEGVVAVKAIPPPFDQAILGPDTAPGRVAIKKALDALQAQTASIVAAARALDIPLNLK